MDPTRSSSNGIKPSPSQVLEQTHGFARTDRIDQFLRVQRIPTPFVIIDLDIVRDNYRLISTLFPQAIIFYAVEANPAAAVIAALAELGAKFDLASAGEIKRCQELGIDADRLSFGNTIKREAEIARAH